MAHGADFVATGHYAQVEKFSPEIIFSQANFSRRALISHSKLLVSKRISGDSFCLKKSKDSNKDQTYFLWTLTQEQLSKTLFPIGHLEKSDVRKLAEKYNLPTANKKDSQGVCFLGMIDMKEFLSHYIDKKEGTVLDQDGRIIGVHEGAVFITIGQRHGFTITEKSPDDKPYYVISKDIVCNTITVSDDLAQVTESMEESKSLLTLSNVILNTEINQDKIYTARVRYRQELKECRLTQLTNGGLEVQFVTPQLNPSKGQSCVIYDGELCIGGGIIE